MNYLPSQKYLNISGLLFWTDWDKDIPRIECAEMSGTNRKVIFNVTNYKNGAWPNGLSLDYTLKRLYWIDARADSIHSSKYDGSDHREIMRNRQGKLLGQNFTTRWR